VTRYRVLTTVQIARLVFGCRGGKLNTRCQLRLQLLFHHGFLWREEQSQRLSEGRKPFLYFLDKRGAQALATHRACDIEDIEWDTRDRDTRSLFLEHLLATNDVRVAVEVAARVAGWSLPIWLDDKTLKRQHAGEYVFVTSDGGVKRRVVVIPDGYFTIDTGRDVYHCCLEVDRRTETGQASTWGRRDWALKVAGYLAWHRSGAYTARYQTRALRVLVVTTGDVRLRNLKAITERVGGKRRFVFTTFDAITGANILTDAIWRAASEEGTTSLVVEDTKR
jgi:hypothetical protein